MVENTSSLWPADFGVVPEMTPVAILRQQAAALGDRTQNIVFGRVVTMGEGDRFIHRFNLLCTPLRYEVELFSITHATDLYPVEIITLPQGIKVQAASSDELKARLKTIFAEDRTKKIIASLIAQSKG